MRRLLRNGLRKTAGYWPALRRTYAWVERAAAILANANGEPAARIERRYAGLLGAMTRAMARARTYRGALAHFLKVTRSYWPGLFHCYRVPDLPRTNNDLEHAFGTYRYNERRATGRKVAAAGAVVRGSVRMIAAMATRRGGYGGDDLAPHEVDAWRRLRADLRRRREPRTLGRRFRRDPDAYLRRIEHDLLKATLPP